MAGAEFSEEWLQKLVEANAEALPISDIEPPFGGAVSLCRELPVKSGSCDNVLINEYGYITLVECKLWRNPESQRKVVAQVLDYAKDLANLDYAAFEKAIMRARKDNSGSLIEVMARYFPDIDESNFIDSVSRNLKEARFLLLIAGDGIRENAEALVEFLNRFSFYRFTIAFLELPVYEVGESKGFIITPRVLSKTTELTRIVEPGINEAEVSAPSKPSSASQNEFFERLSAHIENEFVKGFRRFTEELTSQLDLTLKTGRGKRLSLSIKSSDDRYNFACVWQDGRVDFYGLVQRTGELGRKDIGTAYLEEMAELADGQLQRHSNEWNWKVVKDGEVPSIVDFLRRSGEWFSLIERTLSAIREAEDQ